MKTKLFFLSLLLSWCFMIGQYVPPPQLGDFQSKISGPWTNPSSWETYNGTAWVATTSYPGQGTSTTSQGTYKVIIRPGHNIQVTSSQEYYFGDLYILSYNPTTQTYPSTNDANNALVQYGQLTLSGNQNFFKLLGTNQDIFIFGGKMVWSNNNIEVFLNLGTSLVLTNYNSSIKEAGTNLLIPESTSDPGTCTGNQQLSFLNPNGTTAIQYAVCNGGNSNYNFKDLNFGGGTIQAVPSASATNICVGTPVTLSGNYTGYVPVGDLSSIDYIWTGTGPDIDPGLGETLYSFGPTTSSSNPTQTLNLVTPGVYTFSLQARYYSNLYSAYIYGIENVVITVNSSNSVLCGCYKNPAIDSSVNPSSFGITSLKKGNNNQATDNWPIGRQGGAMVLESKTKGLVINRISDVSAIQNPVEGMIIYDTTAKKLKVYKPLAGGGMGWKSVEDPACPTL